MGGWFVRSSFVWLAGASGGMDLGDTLTGVVMQINPPFPCVRLVVCWRCVCSVVRLNLFPARFQRRCAARRQELLLQTLAVDHDIEREVAEAARQLGIQLKCVCLRILPLRVPSAEADLRRRHQPPGAVAASTIGWANIVRVCVCVCHVCVCVRARRDARCLMVRMSAGVHSHKQTPTSCLVVRAQERLGSAGPPSDFAPAV